MLRQFLAGESWVGDAEFQKKCLGKMGDVAKDGRTVLFVSHNMVAIQSITARCLLLHAGRSVQNGFTIDVLDKYLSKSFIEGSQLHNSDVYLDKHPRRLPDMIPCLRRIWLTDENGNHLTVVPMGSKLVVHVEYEANGVVRQPIVGLGFESAFDGRLFSINNRIAPGAQIMNAPSRGILSCHIKLFPLMAGEYFVTVSFARSAEKDIDRIDKACKIMVVPADLYGTGIIPSKQQGKYLVDAVWEFSPCS